MVLPMLQSWMLYTIIKLWKSMRSRTDAYKQITKLFICIYYFQ